MSDDGIDFPQAVCIDTQPHAKHRIAGTWRDQCPGLEEEVHGIPATAEERHVPAFTFIRVDQAGPGAVVLGTVDHEGIVHAFTPERGFTRTLATRHAGQDGWWRLTFNDGYQSEHLGFELLAVTGQAPAAAVTEQTGTDNDDQEWERCCERQDSHRFAVAGLRLPAGFVAREVTCPCCRELGCQR